MTDRQIATLRYMLRGVVFVRRRNRYTGRLWWIPSDRKVQRRAPQDITSLVSRGLVIVRRATCGMECGKTIAALTAAGRALLAVHGGCDER